MTLVIARKQQNRLTIAADSQVYNLSILHLERTRLIVKVIRLSSTLVVAFAGTIPLALRAIMSIIKLELLSNLDALLNELLQHNQTTNNAVDFIIASLTPEPTLNRISDGVIERDLAAAWIGNKQAFEDYQRFANRDIKPQVASALQTLTP